MMALRPGMCTALSQPVWEKLRNASVKTKLDFITKDLGMLSQQLRIPYKDLLSIRRVLIAESAAYPIPASTMYQAALSSLACLSTCCESLDLLLEGGLYTGEVTELAGSSTAGKSKICLWAAAAAVSSGHHSVLYIDTCCSFCPEAILDVMVHQNARSQHDEVLLQEQLSRIQCVQAFNVFDLLSVLSAVSSDLTKQETESSPPLKLLIVDNLSTVIQSIMAGGAVYSQSMLSQIGMKLKYLAINFAVAVVVTNSMVASFHGSDWSDRHPALGKLWSHMVHSRIVLERVAQPGMGDNMLRKACLVKSCRQKTPESVTFSLDRDTSYAPV